MTKPNRSVPTGTEIISQTCWPIPIAAASDGGASRAFIGPGIPAGFGHDFPPPSARGELTERPAAAERGRFPRGHRATPNRATQVDGETKACVSFQFFALLSLRRAARAL